MKILYKVSYTKDDGSILNKLKITDTKNIGIIIEEILGETGDEAIVLFITDRILSIDLSKRINDKQKKRRK
jgi:NTP pyrophosphatase (non-canonical NTP hydrolase)